MLHVEHPTPAPTGELYPTPVLSCKQPDKWLETALKSGDKHYLVMTEAGSSYYFQHWHTWPAIAIRVLETVIKMHHQTQATRVIREATAESHERHFQDM
jgi:hypothetical protein